MQLDRESHSAVGTRGHSLNTTFFSAGKPKFGKLGKALRTHEGAAAKTDAECSLDSIALVQDQTTLRTNRRASVEVQPPRPISQFWV